MSRTVRALAALTLAVLFLTSPALASTSAPGSGTTVWGSVWEWVLDLLLPGGEEPPNQGSGGDAGGGIDPNGVQVLGAPSRERTEHGPAVR